MIQLISFKAMIVPSATRQRFIIGTESQVQQSGEGDNADVGYQVNSYAYPEFLTALGHDAKCVGHIFWVRRSARHESTDGASKEDKEKQKSTKLADA